jgi:cytidylate kinase
MNNIERLISEQVLTWSKREEKFKKESKTHEAWPVITISREYGARGRLVAKELNKRTGFKVWDKELLSIIAEEAGADEQFLSSLDERRRKLIDDTLLGSKHSNTHYFRSLLRVVHTIGEHGNGIIVGRGSNYIIKSPTSLRVRLVCPIKKRRSFIAEVEGISEKKAKKLIKTRDAERDDFIQYYFNRNPGDPQDYDIVINSGIFDNDQIVDLILFAYEKKVGKAIPLIGEK